MKDYLSAPTMSHDAHAAYARAKARALGLHDCIHYAPEWRSRADALYAIANAYYDEFGTQWFADKQGSPFLLADGRMVVTGNGIWFAEPIGKEG